MKAKARIVEAINNGTTDTNTIQSEVNQTIEDYYSVREQNLISQYNSDMFQIEYAINTSLNDSGLNDRLVNLTTKENDNGMSQVEILQLRSWDPSSSEDVNYTLVNGTKTTHRNIGANIGMYNYYHDEWTGYARNGSYGLYNWTYYKSSSSTDWYNSSIRVKNVSGPDIDRNISGSVVMNFTAYEQALGDIENAATQVKSNYDTSFVSSVVTSYNKGELNLSELLTPEQLAQDWATSYNQTGESIYKWANLAALGLDSPDLANVSYMNISYRKDVGQRHVTLNFSGSPTASTYDVTVIGPEVGTFTRSLNGSEDIRVPVGKEATVSVATDSDNATWDARPKPWMPYAHEGESKSVSGVTVTVEDHGPWDRRTEAGMLFAAESPSGGFQVGESYEASNWSSVYFSPRGENTSIRQVVDDFTILNAVNDDGENLTVVKTRDYNYQTDNASDLKEQLRQLEELRKEIEKRETISGGGLLGNLFGGGAGASSGLILLALLGAALILLRD